MANQLLIAVRSDSGTKAKMQEHELPEILTSRSIPVGAGDVVLLADDEAGIRTLVRTILEANGYIVIEARNGLEGLAVCRTYAGRIDLLLSDVVMPELGGRELADGVLRLRPGMRVMFMSGYAEKVPLKDEDSHGSAFLQKPFTPFALVSKVRETLDGTCSAA